MTPEQEVIKNKVNSFLNEAKTDLKRGDLKSCIDSINVAKRFAEQLIAMINKN